MENKTPTIKENCREQNKHQFRSQASRNQHILGTGLSNTLLSSQETSARDQLDRGGAATLAGGGLSRQIGSIRLRRATPEHPTTRPHARSESRSAMDSPADRPVHSQRRTWPGSRRQHQFTPAPRDIATSSDLGRDQRLPPDPADRLSRPAGRGNLRGGATQRQIRRP
jgi:hypothetical protein